MTRANAARSHPEPDQRRGAEVVGIIPAMPDAWGLYVGDINDAMIRVGSACLALSTALREGDPSAMQSAVDTIRAEALSASHLANHLSRHVANFRNRSTRVRHDR